MPSLVKKLRTIILSHLGVLLLVSTVHAGPTPSGTGIPVTTGTWTMVLSRGLPVSSNDWEQLVYVSAVQRSMMLSQYHQNNSEPNESLIGYNFDTNSWDILDMGGLFHTENMPEGGESEGYFDFDPNNNIIAYHCCTSGSNQAENVNHTWWFDVLGQSGRDKQTSAEPVSLQPGGAFDVAHNVAVMHGGASYVGTWIYDPVGNTWQPKTAGGTPPDPSVILPGMAYSSSAQQVFLYGGRNSAGTTYYPDLYSYDVPSNSWTLVAPTGGVKPPGRCCTNFAYDSTDNVFLLYGGRNASGVLGDTWVYDPVANAWTQLNPAQSPSINTVSDFTRLSYDSDHNAFVLAHLGSGGYFGGNWVTLPIQTWLFRYAGTGPNAGTLLSTAQPAPGSINRNTAGWADDPALASSGNSLSVAWSETGSPFDPTQAAWPHIYANQFSSGSWNTMGASYQSISNANAEAHAPSLAIVGGTPWISWYQPVSRVQQVFAESWNGSSWQGGSIGLVGGSSVQGRSQLANIAGTPYIGFIEVNKSVSPQTAFAYVKAWNGTSWALQGGGALNFNNVTGTTATSISLANDGTYPYAAWTEYVRTSNSFGALVSSAPQVYVSHWNGSQWIPVGGSLNVSSSGRASDASIAFFAGQPYVAWTERSQTGNNQLYVATWNGASWILTGSGSLNIGGANGWAFRPSLVADPVGNNLYIAWVEQTALGQKAQVFVAQLTGNSWTMLGNALNADPILGSAQRVNLGVFNGQPVAAWGEVDLGALRQIYVSQWSGSSWTQLAGTGGSRDTTPPTIPKNLSATAASSSQINLSWAGSTDTVGVAGYFIYRGGSQIANVTTSLNYQDTGLNPSTLYVYTVAAYDAAGNVSAQSSPASATTLSNGLLISITAPANGGSVSGLVTVSANATDNLVVTGVQFQIDGTNLGSPVPGPGPSFSTPWDTTTASNGSHTVSAVATDTANNQASASVNVTVNNTVGPVISRVSAGSISSSGATITWATNVPATSQVAYGTTTAYGSTSPFDPTFVTSHSVTLSGLAASTTYHYQALSQDTQGDAASSPDHAFTTPPVGLQTVFEVQGNASEVSGTSNGSVVTPTTAPAGFTGVVVVKSTGSVTFIPAQSGNGVYFSNCCKGTNDAYFKFSGSTVGNLFNVSQGQVSFSLQSRYSFAQRKANAATPRYSFDVRDGSGNHLYSFMTQVSGGRLQFNYMAGSPVQVYRVAQGTEDALFGSGVNLQVTIAWGGSAVNLYLNGTLVKSSPYNAPTPNWSSSTVFDLGALEYQAFGGYNVSDDIVDNFTVAQ
jgi:hypothetical protein